MIRITDMSSPAAAYAFWGVVGAAVWWIWF